MSCFEPADEDLSRYPGFQCFKSTAPVHYPKRWHRDALIQAALDPAVSAIGPFQQKPWPELVEFAFSVTIADSRFTCLIDGPSGRPQLGPAPPTLRISRSALRSEPLYSTCRAVWSRKRLSTDPAARYQVLEATAATVEGARAGEVIDLIRRSHREPIDQLLAMLAQGFLIADLSGGLSARTLIRPGPQFEPRNESNPRRRLHAILTDSDDLTAL